MRCHNLATRKGFHFKTWSISFICSDFVSLTVGFREIGDIQPAKPKSVLISSGNEMILPGGDFVVGLVSDGRCARWGGKHVVILSEKAANANELHYCTNKNILQIFCICMPTEAIATKVSTLLLRVNILVNQQQITYIPYCRDQVVHFRTAPVLLKLCFPSRFTFVRWSLIDPQQAMHEPFWTISDRVGDIELVGLESGPLDRDGAVSV